MLREQFKTEHFSVRFYLRDPSRVIVVFASAGSRRIDGYSEEYGKTLARLNVSVIFVTARLCHWYNHEETDCVLRRVAEMIGGFKHAGAMGESLGGAGALLFTRFARNVSRVLAFAPQYSVAEPFISFDKRFRRKSRMIEQFHYKDFAEVPDPSICLLVYGNISWRDYVHRANFALAGYPILTVDNAPHEVSRHLRMNFGESRLSKLIGLFCDFTLQFNAEVVLRIGEISWSDTELKTPSVWSSALNKVLLVAWMLWWAASVTWAPPEVS